MNLESRVATFFHSKSYLTVILVESYKEIKDCIGCHLLISFMLYIFKPNTVKIYYSSIFATDNIYYFAFSKSIIQIPESTQGLSRDSCTMVLDS